MAISLVDEVDNIQILSQKTTSPSQYCTSCACVSLPPSLPLFQAVEDSRIKLFSVNLQFTGNRTFRARAFRKLVRLNHFLKLQMLLQTRARVCKCLLLGINIEEKNNLSILSIGEINNEININLDLLPLRANLQGLQQTERRQINHPCQIWH